MLVTIIKDKLKKTISFIIALIAFLSAIAGLYSYLYKEKPKIDFNIISEANLVDIYKPLQELKIFFKGDDIQDKNLNLRIYTLRIENNGGVDILQNFYDQKDIWGIGIKDGEFVEARLMASNSDYILKRLQPNLKENTLQFEKIIFETGKFFVLEILVLHNKDFMPELVPLGKIAGIEKIIPAKVWLQKDTKTFFADLLYGSLIVHILRAVIYLTIIIVLIIIFVVLTTFVEDLQKKIRKKKIGPYLKSIPPPAGTGEDFIYNAYIYYGIESLRTLKHVLGNAAEMKKELLAFRERIYLENIDVDQKPIYFFSGEQHIIISLISNKFIKLDDAKNLIIDEELQSSLDYVLMHLDPKIKRL